jgi:hypothetical protein
MSALDFFTASRFVSFLLRAKTKGEITEKWLTLTAIRGGYTACHVDSEALQHVYCRGYGIGNFPLILASITQIDTFNSVIPKMNSP